MFNNYKIIDNTLFLSINFNSEFSIDNFLNHKYSSMKKEIKKLIKKLNFTGEKIAIVLGGLVLATILIVENPKISDKIDMVFVDSNIIPSNEVIKIDKEVKQQKQLKEENIIDKQVANKKENKPENKQEKVLPVNNVNSSVEEKVLAKENKDITVTVYRKNGSVITLDMEKYLIGVVGAEVPAEFNIEALKAQAVISRTYALKCIKDGKKLTDTVTTQVYKDNSELKSIWGDLYDKYYNKIKEAVDATKGQSVYYNDELISALFFATSNGKTEDSKNVWGGDIPYLKSVDSSWDKETTPYLREEVKDLNNVLNILGVSSSEFSIISRNESGRVEKMMFGNKTYTGVEFRNLLGLRSADFDLEVVDNNLKIITRGYGHGVGLSQYGANKMALSGKNYQEIIKYYYTGVNIK